MTTYLSRLVDRTLGRAPLVQPILAPRFGRGLDLAAEEWAAEAEATAPPPRAADVAGQRASMPSAEAVALPRAAARAIDHPASFAQAAAPATVREAVVEKILRLEAGAAPAPLAGDAPSRVEPGSPAPLTVARSPAAPGEAAAPPAASLAAGVQEAHGHVPALRPATAEAALPAAVAAPGSSHAAQSSVEGAPASRPRHETIEQPEPSVPATKTGTTGETPELPARAAISREQRPPALVARRQAAAPTVHPAAAPPAPAPPGRAAPAPVGAASPPPLAPRTASPQRGPVPAAARAPTASGQAPVIRVHVGRVDVRAVHAPPPPAPAAKTTRLSLADYLERQRRS